jgi:hypothetical protein
MFSTNHHPIPLNHPTPEAAVNTIEFSLRENNTGSFPRGLSLMLRAVGAWIYDRDPYVPIQVCGSDARACVWVCCVGCMCVWGGAWIYDRDPYVPIQARAGVFNALF